MSRRTRVTVVGGGISGLASAHALAKAGAEVVLLEASDQLGGLGTFFESEGRWIDRFYHCIMPSDDHLLGLISEVGLEDQLYWRSTGMGFVVGGVHYSFNTPLDLLRFSPLTFTQRIRFGVSSLLLRQLGRRQDLDSITSAEWLSGIYGSELWLRIWDPLYRAKFGAAVDVVPALYLWQRLGRESNRARRGYLRVGHKGLIDGIAGAIRAMGGDVRTQTPVNYMDGTPGAMTVRTEGGEEVRSDWVISTVPLPLLRKLTDGGSLEGTFRDPNLQYQGVVNTLFFLSRPLDGFYWSPVVDSETEFDGVVEMSALVDTAQFGDRHLVYAVKYLDRDDPMFRESDEDIGTRWQSQLVDLYGHLHLSEEEILERRVFRAPFVEPVFPTGYSADKPAIRAAESGLFLATTAQVYPNITSWNSSTRLASEAVDTLLSVDV